MAGTCTETGLTEGKHCSGCGTVLVAQEVVPAKDHTEVTDPAVQATCTEDGLTEGKHCSVCGTVLIAQDIVPAKGHTEVTDPAVEATCTEDGLTEGKHCSVCGTVLAAQETVPAKGHTEVTDPAVPATCTEDGLTEGKHCSVCGTVLVAQDIVPAKGHTEVMDPSVPATCTEDGLTEGKHCSVCGTVLIAQDVVPAKGHMPGDPVKEKEIPAEIGVAGSYEEAVYCTVCGTELSRTAVATDPLPEEEPEPEEGANVILRIKDTGEKAELIFLDDGTYILKAENVKESGRFRLSGGQIILKNRAGTEFAAAEDGDGRKLAYTAGGETFEFLFGESELQKIKAALR